MTYYIDQLEILWEQMAGVRDVVAPTVINIAHSENFIWSSDYVVRDQAISAGNVNNFLLNWAEQLIIDPLAWNDSTAAADWTSPVVNIGIGWRPDYVTIDYIDREDYKYVSTRKFYRGSNTPPVVNESNGSWLSGEHPHSTDAFSLLEWVEVLPSIPIDSTATFVQVKIDFVTTDPEVRFPIFKSCYLAKCWNENASWTLPSDVQKYTIGEFEDSEETDFYGIRLSPALDSTSPLEGIWISPVHDFGAAMHPRWASWYAMIPNGSYVGNPNQTIQVRGSDTAPTGGWIQDNLPDDNDPIWGISGTLENSWQNIEIEQSITDVIGVVRYAQFKLTFGVLE